MEDPRDDEQYIDRVVVRLHPTFTPPMVVLQEPPFRVRRVRAGPHLHGSSMLMYLVISVPLLFNEQQFVSLFPCTGKAPCSREDVFQYATRLCDYATYAVASL